MKNTHYELLWTNQRAIRSLEKGKTDLSNGEKESLFLFKCFFLFHLLWHATSESYLHNENFLSRTCLHEIVTLRQFFVATNRTRTLCRPIDGNSMQVFAPTALQNAAIVKAENLQFIFNLNILPENESKKFTKWRYMYFFAPIISHFSKYMHSRANFNYSPGSGLNAGINRRLRSTTRCVDVYRVKNRIYNFLISWNWKVSLS